MVSVSVSILTRNLLHGSCSDSEKKRGNYRGVYLLLAKMVHIRFHAKFNFLIAEDGQLLDHQLLELGRPTST